MTAQRLETSITIKAPRAKVFAAWTKPELMRNWFAPGPMTVASVSADPRPGGKYSITMQGKDASPTVTGEYQEVITNEKLVFTWGWEGDPSHKTIVTILFRDIKEGTEVALKHERFADVAARDKHRQGWDGCLAKLDQALAP